MYMSRDCPFYLCAPVVLLRPSGLSYTPVHDVFTRRTSAAAHVSDGCWGCDVKRVTESLAGAARAVMT